MTFTPNIPATGQSLGSSRTQVLNNFTNYFNTVSQDHVAPNATGQGKHNKSTYPDQASDPVTIVNEIAAYGKSISGVSQLFLRPESAGNTIQMTRLDTGALSANSGYSFLPGGVIIQWGIVVATSGAGTLTNFPIVFPNACFGVSLGIVGLTISSLHSVWCKTNYPSTASADRTHFQCASDSGSLGCFMIAIGN